MDVIRRLIPFLVVFAGFALLNYGLREVYEPASWILTGLLLIAAGLVIDLDRRRS